MPCGVGVMSGSGGTGTVPVVTHSYRPRARSSCFLFIFERPWMLRCLASLYNWSYVGPWAPLCERSPPRREEDMSFTELRLAVFDSRAGPAPC